MRFAERDVNHVFGVANGGLFCLQALLCGGVERLKHRLLLPAAAVKCAASGNEKKAGEEKKKRETTKNHREKKQGF